MDNNKVNGLVLRCLALLASGAGEEAFLEEVVFLVRGLSDAECQALLAGLVRAEAPVSATVN